VLQIWRCVVSYQDASNRPRILIIVLLSLLSLVSLGRSTSISTPRIQVAHENTRMWGHGVGQWGFGLLNSVHIALPSRQYHTLSANCFSTRLPSNTLPRCPWSRTQISLYQLYRHVCRIFSTGCHYQWHIHCPDLRPAAAGRVLGAYPLPNSPSDFRRWPGTP
jgi:hypothetical protein